MHAYLAEIVRRMFSYDTTFGSVRILELVQMTCMHIRSRHSVNGFFRYPCMSVFPQSFVCILKYLGHMICMY
jgi:hypothetical protein